MKKILILLAFGFLYALPASAYESVPIHVRIDTATTTLFDGSLDVLPCSPAGNIASTTSGYCALEESGLPITWSSYGGDYFLESVGGAGNDYTANSYWGWFSNLEYGQTSLSSHALFSGERLLVTLGKMPLKLVLGTTTPAANGTTSAEVLEFGFDSSWNGVWMPAASSTLVLGGVAHDSENGIFVIGATTTPVAVYASKSGFVETEISIIAPRAAAEAPQESHSSSREESVTVSAPVEAKIFDANKAASYLWSAERDDGSFGGGMYSDWAAIACAAVSHPCASKVANYVKGNAEISVRATDNERKAMALMALGINPYDGTPVNYIEKITQAFDGNQIGDSSLVNDDVFALFPLIKVGYLPSDPIVSRTADFILSKQSPDGSWEGSVDFTSASIQALGLVPQTESVRGARERAKAFLQSRQNGDGGFGSSYSTSWAIQAILSLGESPDAWLANGHSPFEYLGMRQESDGGMEPLSAGESNRVWATSYALVAASRKTWADILRSFPRSTVVEEAVSSVQSQEVPKDSPEATSTVPVISDMEVFAESVSAPIFAPEPPVSINVPEASFERTVRNDPVSSFDEATSTKLLAAAFQSTPDSKFAYFVIMPLSLFGVWIGLKFIV